MVTGANGFVGKHLVRELAAGKIKTIALGREKTAHPEIGTLADQYLACDLTDAEAVAGLPWHKVDAVINLAGMANVGNSFTEADAYRVVNVSILTTIAKHLADSKLPVRLIAVSTGAVYDYGQPMPLTEKSRLITDGSPYAMSKLLMEQALGRWHKPELDYAVVRPFNHFGPGQTAGFIIPDIVNKIRQAVKVKSQVPVGNLATQRDYTDVRDVVKAYVSLALAPADALSARLYNVCSGHPRSGEEVLKTIANLIPGAKKLKYVQDPGLVRPNDPPVLFGDAGLIFKDIGWQPAIPFEQTIEDFVNSL